MPLPEVGFLNECFSYNKKTGALVWKKRPSHHFSNDGGCNIWNSRYANTRTGYLMRNGYLQTRISGKLYLTHRIVYKMKYGVDPAHEIDHRNRNPRDCRWDNLREATSTQNSQNQSLRKNNTGFKGVYYDRERGKFQVGIRVNKRKIHLGRYATAEEAYKVYCVAAKKYFGEFRCIG